MAPGKDAAGRELDRVCPFRMGTGERAIIQPVEGPALPGAFIADADPVLSEPCAEVELLARRPCYRAEGRVYARHQCCDRGELLPSHGFEYRRHGEERSASVR